MEASVFLFVPCLYLSHCPLSFPAPDLHALGLNCLWLSSGTWTTFQIQVVCFHLDFFPSFMWDVCVCSCLPAHLCFLSRTWHSSSAGIGTVSLSTVSTVWPQLAKNSPQTGFPVGALVCNSHTVYVHPTSGVAFLSLSRKACLSPSVREITAGVMEVVTLALFTFPQVLLWIFLGSFQN